MKKTLNVLQSLLKRNSPVILSSTAITGVITTAYLTGRAAWNSQYKLYAYDPVGGYLTKREKLQRDFKLLWKDYIPAAASGAVTIGCIIGVTRVTNKRAAVAQAAFIMSERAYSEYRDKVIEEYGERKDQGIRDSIAEDKIRKNPPPTTGVLIMGSGNILCCELHTGRYFASDMESLRKAQNDLNARLIGQDACNLDDFYYLVGLSPTAHSGDLGWNSDKMLELEFTSVLTEDGRPCLAVGYNYTRPLFEGIYR